MGNTVSGAVEKLKKAADFVFGDLLKELKRGHTELVGGIDWLGTWLSTHLGEDGIAKAFGIAHGDPQYKTDDKTLKRKQYEVLLSIRRGLLHDKIAELSRAGQQSPELAQLNKLADSIDQWIEKVGTALK